MSQLTIPCPTWKEVKPWLWRLALLALVVYVAYLVREIWLPLAIAFLVALVLDPVVDRLERRGWSRMWGAALIFGCFLVGVVGLSIISVPIVVNQASEIQKQIDQKLPDRSPAGIDKVLKQEGVSPGLREVIKSSIINAESSFNKSGNVIATKAMELSTNLIWVVIIPIVAFYALKDFHLILAKMLLIVKPRRRDLVQSAVSEVTAIFAKYMRGLLLVSGLNGLATWILLAVLGVPSSFVLGIAAGLLYMVPYIGAIVTVVLIAIVAFLSGGASLMVTTIIANIILHQVIFDQVITPRIVGGHVGLHPIISIIALLMGQALLGIVGMILAVPVAACIQIGVLAMMPKLKQEIELPTVGDAKEDPHGIEDSKDKQLKVDETEELHVSVKQAINTIEAKLPANKPAEDAAIELDGQVIEQPTDPKLITAQMHSDIGDAVAAAEKKSQIEQERKARIFGHHTNPEDETGR